MYNTVIFVREHLIAGLVKNKLFFCDVCDDDQECC